MADIHETFAYVGPHLFALYRTGNVASGSANITNVNDDTEDIVAGMNISGTGIPAGAKILSFNPSSTPASCFITMDTVATGNATGATLVISNGGWVRNDYPEGPPNVDPGQMYGRVNDDGAVLVHVDLPTDWATTPWEMTFLVNPTRLDAGEPSTFGIKFGGAHGTGGITEFTCSWTGSNTASYVMTDPSSFPRSIAAEAFDKTAQHVLRFIGNGNGTITFKHDGVTKTWGPDTTTTPPITPGVSQKVSVHYETLGSGGLSGVWGVTAIHVGALTAPTPVFVSKTSTTITVSFPAATGGVSTPSYGYTVRAGLTTGTTIAENEDISSPTTLTGLTPNTLYFIRTHVIDGVNNTADSDEIQVTTDAASSSAHSLPGLSLGLSLGL